MITNTDMSDNVRRGYVPEDERDFSDKALPVLRKALSDIAELLDRGYPVKPASTFVGNHYQLTERQRLALARAASSKDKIALRRSKQLDTAPHTVNLDGLNIIITLETALSGTTLYRCMDGTVRDLAAMRGAYRIIGHTHTAVSLVLSYLEEKGAENACFYLDAPVSNTGRLKTLILEAAESSHVNVQCELVPNADTILKDKDGVITTDAIILDECHGWLSAAADIIREKIPDTRVIDLTNQPTKGS